MARKRAQEAEEEEEEGEEEGVDEDEDEEELDDEGAEEDEDGEEDENDEEDEENSDDEGGQEDCSDEDYEEEAPALKKTKRDSRAPRRTTPSKTAAAASGKGKAAVSAARAAPAKHRTLTTPRAARDEAEASETLALQRKARAIHVVRGDRQPEYEHSRLNVSKALLQRLGGGGSIDVMTRSKGSTGKAKYLLALPGKFAPIAAGRIGSIERLNTSTPELYFDWPGKGKLRLRGTLVYPTTSILTMQAKGNQVHVEDSFENIIVFSEAQWLEKTGGAATSVEQEGEEASADDEQELLEAPLPLADLQRRLHKTWSYAAGCAAEHAGSAGASTEAGASRPSTAKPSAPAKRKAGAAESDANSSDDGATAAKRRPARARSAVTYIDKGSDASDPSSEQEDDDAPLVRVRPAPPAVAPKPSTKPRASAPKPSAKVVLSLDCSDEEPLDKRKQPRAATNKPAARAKPPKTPAARKPAKRKKQSDDSSSSEFEGEGTHEQPSAPTRSTTRRASSSARKSYADVSDSGDSMS